MVSWKLSSFLQSFNKLFVQNGVKNLKDNFSLYLFFIWVLAGLVAALKSSSISSSLLESSNIDAFLRGATAFSLSSGPLVVTSPRTGS